MKSKIASTAAERSSGPEYLTRAGVAQLLGVSPNTVTRWAREGRLPSQLTLGGHHRFERSVIETLRSEMRRAGQADRAEVKTSGLG
jgi:excisionase family DNA binding protein